jgi:hypothetical protein
MRFRVAPLVSIVGLLVAGAGVQALAEEGSDRYLSEPRSSPGRHTFLAETHFHSGDVALGLTYRYALVPARFFGAFLHFSLRPFYDARIEEIRPGYKLVFDEFRYLMAVGLEEELPLTRHIGVFAGAGAGYTRADYEGTARAPEEGWTPLTHAGISFRIPIESEGDGLVRAGYRYVDLRGDDKNWWYAALGFGF